MTMTPQQVLIAEENHRLRFLDAVFGTPIGDQAFTRKCIQHHMHATTSRRAFVRSLYVHAITASR